MTTDNNTAAQFIHLRTHSEYSLSDGIVRVKPLVKKAKALGMPAVAITDRVNLFALVKFYRAAIAEGVKPIVGADLRLIEDDVCYSFTAYCMNQTGYHNLTALISKAYVDGQVNDERTVTWAWLQAHHEGLLILSGGVQGDIGQAIVKDQPMIAEQKAQRWKSLLGDRFYLEITRTERENESDYLHAAVGLAEQLSLPVVATNDVMFIDEDDFEAHEARVCIHAGYVLDDAKRPHDYSEQQYFKSAEAMTELFADIPEALQNTVEIAKRCTLTLQFGEVHLPQFPIPDDTTIEAFIEAESQKGLQQRFGHKQLSDEQLKPYQDRLTLELGVINNMGFPGYFLIVADFIGWAKSQNIPVGPGRGSGAGSLVAYVLGITELDPLEHELLFERFLNPERVSMPDFDIDFCMEGRDRVIDYVATRYGREAVSQIITYGTMAAKAVVRDVGRVLGMSYGHVDKIAKLIPFEIGMTLDKALADEEQLQQRYDDDDEVATLIDLAKKLEGITRNAGKHAGGVVIAPTKLTDFTPLYCEPGGENLVTQFDKDDVEAVGLVKFDFLGLRTLTIIDWALQTINKKRTANGEAPIDIGSIPLDDEKTFMLLQSCATTAVFQLESRGMKELVRRLVPDSFEEITALVALFRPGPLQSGMVDDFIDRKHGRARVHYPHPDLEPILEPTYGVILYQEQVMEIARVLANYSLGGADILRRAMGKKKPEEMAKQRQIFTDGAAARDIDCNVAEHIFDLMEKFAGYGFNKSHSAAYALIAYQTAWLKAHYPAEFMAAVLSSDMDNTDKVVNFLEECERMQLNVNPPNINVGHYPFTVNSQGDIDYGLGAIKGVGEAVVQHLDEEREKNGPFKSVFGFCQRLEANKVNRRMLDPLIRSGAMDVFGVDRAVMFASINKALKSANQKLLNETTGQEDLFGGVSAVTNDTIAQDYVPAEAWNLRTQLDGEKVSLGYYLSGHPLQTFADEIANFTSTTLNHLPEYLRKEPVVAGLLLSYRTIMTRKGKKMAVLLLEDQTGRVEVTLFSDLYESSAHVLIKDHIFVVKGKVEEDDYTGGVRMVAEKIEAFDAVRKRLAKRLVIAVQDQAQVDDVLSQLPVLFQPFVGGRCPVAISYHAEGAKADLLLGDAWKINPEDALLEELKRVCGEASVAVEY